MTFGLKFGKKRKQKLLICCAEVIYNLFLLLLRRQFRHLGRHGRRGHAELIISSECAITDIPKHEPPAPPAGDMGGMGGMY